MKLLLEAILLIMLLIIGSYLFKIYRRSDANRLAGSVSILLGIGFIVLLCNFINLLVPEKLPSLISYSIYFILSDWLLYCLLKFSVEFIGQRFDRYIQRGFLITVLIMDSVSIAMNPFFKHLFDLKIATFCGESGFYTLVTKPAFYIHYGLVMLFALVCFLSLFYRAFKAAQFYRKKYLSKDIYSMCDCSKTHCSYIQ